MILKLGLWFRRLVLGQLANNDRLLKAKKRALAKLSTVTGTRRWYIFPIRTKTTFARSSGGINFPSKRKTNFEGNDKNGSPKTLENFDIPILTPLAHELPPVNDLNKTKRQRSDANVSYISSVHTVPV